MKNVAKKSTSLKPLCPPKNGLHERLVNGCASSPDLSDRKLEERQKMSATAYSGQTKDDCAKNSRNNLAISDDNSSDSLLEVSCVEVVDAPNVKSPPGNDLGPCSRSSTPASVIRMPSGRVSGVAKAIEKGADLLSDEDVIICDRSSPGANHLSGAKSPNGLVCRVDNFEIFENKVDSDEQTSKHADDKEIEVIDVDSSVAVTASDEETAKKRTGVKRISVDDTLSNEVSHAKKSRLEAAEAAVLTSFVNAQHLTDRRDNKISSTSKHLNELVRTCIEEYINKSHSSIIRQLKAEVDQLKKSRDEWKEIADKLRKEIALVQSTHQRTERRRSSVTRVQRRSVGCQAREKPCNPMNRSPGRSGTSEASKVVSPATSNDAMMALAPSVLPPASSNISTNQRLKWIHQQGIRMSNPGLVSGALKSVSLPVASDLSLVPLTVRPQSVSAIPSSSTVMIDLTAEDDGRTRQRQQNAIVPSGILGSIVQPGNMVLAPNSSTYLLYTPPTRPAVIKPGEMAGVTSLPTIALGSSMASGEGYHSLPSLVSINNRPGTVLQVVNMRPPPPLQSAPLRSTLPVLAPANIQRIAVSSSAVLQHPAPLPPSPINQPAPPDARQIPPKPTLKLSRVAQGIVLSWNASITVLQEEPSTYQLYAYQQGHELPSSTLWKKVGNVKALALPMACTLTQFQVGNKYHFAVRAVDRHGRVGPFSEPGSIHLEGGIT